MTKIKTSELIGLPLRYAVAIAMGGTNFHYDTVSTYWITIEGKCRALNNGWSPLQRFQPDIDWSVGGPIIHRELIRLSNDGPDLHCAFYARRPEMWATTPLIAAMRCYVFSKLGDEVEVPDELLN